MRKAFMSLTVLAVVVAAAGCVTSGLYGPQSSGVVGTWTRTVYAPDASFAVELTFQADGAFAFRLLDEVPGHEDTDGTYTLEPEGVLVFHDRDYDGPGRYSVDRVGDKLILTLDKDTLQARVIVVSGVWTRVR
jgi:hypothetical protein